VAHQLEYVRPVERPVLVMVEQFKQVFHILVQHQVTLHRHFVQEFPKFVDRHSCRLRDRPLSLFPRRRPLRRPFPHNTPQARHLAIKLELVIFLPVSRVGGWVGRVIRCDRRTLLFVQHGEQNVLVPALIGVGGKKR